jgi:hypothetical protein
VTSAIRVAMPMTIPGQADHFNLGTVAAKLQNDVV